MSDPEPTCGQPAWHHDPFYCGRGCPWWTGADDEESSVELDPDRDNP